MQHPHQRPRRSLSSPQFAEETRDKTGRFPTSAV